MVLSPGSDSESEGSSKNADAWALGSRDSDSISLEHSPGLLLFKVSPGDCHVQPHEESWV